FGWQSMRPDRGDVKGGRCAICGSWGACAPWTAHTQPPRTDSRRSPRRAYRAAPARADIKRSAAPPEPTPTPDRKREPPARRRQTTEAALTPARKAKLTPRFVKRDRRSVRQVQAAVARTQRYPEPRLARQPLEHLGRQTARLGSEQERVPVREARVVQ